jgi:hypothetical protein
MKMHESTCANVTGQCNTADIGKSKTPGLAIQGQAKNSNKLKAEYLTLPLSVNGKCSACGYFRRVSQTRRTFCSFTGEKILPLLACDFFTVQGVEYATR